MKVYIFTDMEGIGGVVDWKQALPDSPGYEEARVLLTEEVNAAVDGAFDGGVKDVLVRDGHYMGKNFIVERLRPKARYFMGRAPGYVRMPGIEGSALMLCVGYHSMVNTPAGILGHTMDPSTVMGCRVNGLEMGELGLDALWAGLEGVGVGMVSGDDRIAEEAHKLLGPVETAVVKQGFAKYGGIVMSAEDSRKLIRRAAAAAVKKAAKNKPKPLRLKPPYRVELDVVGQEFVEKKAAMIQGAKVIGSSTIVVEGDDLNRLLFEVFV